MVYDVRLELCMEVRVRFDSIIIPNMQLLGS